MYASQSEFRSERTREMFAYKKMHGQGTAWACISWQLEVWTERTCAISSMAISRDTWGRASVLNSMYVLRLWGETQTHSVRDQTLRHKSQGSREGGAV